MMAKPKVPRARKLSLSQWERDIEEKWDQCEAFKGREPTIEQLNAAYFALGRPKVLNAATREFLQDLTMYVNNKIVHEREQRTRGTPQAWGTWEAAETALELKRHYGERISLDEAVSAVVGDDNPNDFERVLRTCGKIKAGAAPCGILVTSEDKLFTRAVARIEASLKSKQRKQ